MQLNDVQREFRRTVLTGDAKLNIWWGSVRAGKTVGVCATILKLSRKFRNQRFIIAGKSVRLLEDSVLPVLEQWAKKYRLKYRYVGGSRPVAHIGRNSFLLASGGVKGSHTRLAGITAAGAIIDEAPELDMRFLKYVITRCSLPGAKILMTGNPLSPLHQFKTEFLDGEERHNAYVLWTDTTANPHLSAEYLEQLKSSLTGADYARWYLGEWAAEEGLVYPFYATADDTDMGKLKQVVGVDYGDSGVTAAVLFRKYPDYWLAAREYWNDNRALMESNAEPIEADGNAQAIKTAFGWGEYVSDPSGPVLIRALRRAGLPARGANNDVGLGVQTVNQAMQSHQLKIAPSCVRLLTELSSLQWGNPTQAGMKPVKGDDHLADAMRYGAMAIFNLNSAVLATNTPKPVEDKTSIWRNYVKRN